MITLVRLRWAWLILGVILIGVGVAVFATAHAAAPVEIDGTISSYKEYTQSGAYDHNELQLAGDSNTYTLDKTAFHPAMPEEVYKDGKVSIWVDSGSTDVLAITLYDENDLNPIKYTTDQYNKPGSERSDGQSFGLIAGGVGAVLVLVFALTLVLRRDPQPARVQAAVAVPAAGGLSPDGRWYWDGAQWRGVSPDGRYWWDGATWREVHAIPV